MMRRIAHRTMVALATFGMLSTAGIADPLPGSPIVQDFGNARLTGEAGSRLGEWFEIGNLRIMTDRAGGQVTADWLLLSDPADLDRLRRWWTGDETEGCPSRPISLEVFNVAIVADGDALPAAIGGPERISVGHVRVEMNFSDVEGCRPGIRVDARDLAVRGVGEGELELNRASYDDRREASGARRRFASFEGLSFRAFSGGEALIGAGLISGHVTLDNAMEEHLSDVVGLLREGLSTGDVLALLASSDGGFGVRASALDLGIGGLLGPGDRARLGIGPGDRITGDVSLRSGVEAGLITMDIQADLEGLVRAHGDIGVSLSGARDPCPPQRPGSSTSPPRSCPSSFMGRPSPGRTGASTGCSKPFRAGLWPT